MALLTLAKTCSRPTDRSFWGNFECFYTNCGDVSDRFQCSLRRHRHVGDAFVASVATTTDFIKLSCCLRDCHLPVLLLVIKQCVGQTALNFTDWLQILYCNSSRTSGNAGPSQTFLAARPSHSRLFSTLLYSFQPEIQCTRYFLCTSAVHIDLGELPLTSSDSQILQCPRKRM